MTARQIAIITGASKGLGHHIALSLGHAGCSIGVGYCSDRAGALSTVASLELANVTALPVHIDVTEWTPSKRRSTQLSRILGPSRCW